jgi:hypothetical protein
MVRFSTPFKLIISILGLSLIALASQRNSITRSTISGIERGAHDKHQFIAPGPDDSRSPCPALNVLANHGYLYVPSLLLIPILEQRSR